MFWILLKYDRSDYVCPCVFYLLGRVNTVHAKRTIHEKADAWRSLLAT